MQKGVPHLGFMANRTWLESSLRRSASLGLEVLERASRRSVDWTSSGASQTPTTPEDDTAHVSVKRRHKELNDAFAAITEFMAQTTYHCKRFYESGCCTELSDIERNHISRFHSRPHAPRKTTPVQPTRKHGRVSAAGEDFYIEVSPGTYAITASLPELNQQTQLVTIKPGESIDLTFNL